MVLFCPFNSLSHWSFIKTPSSSNLKRQPPVIDWSFFFKENQALVEVSTLWTEACGNWIQPSPEVIRPGNPKGVVFVFVRNKQTLSRSIVLLRQCCVVVFDLCSSSSIRNLVLLGSGFPGVWLWRWRCWLLSTELTHTDAVFLAEVGYLKDLWIDPVRHLLETVQHDKGRAFPFYGAPSRRPSSDQAIELPHVVGQIPPFLVWCPVVGFAQHRPQTCSKALSLR